MELSRVKMDLVRAFALLVIVVSPAVGQLCPPDWAPTGFCNTLDGVVRCSVSYDDGAGPKMYMGGTFSTAGGAITPAVVKWDGVAWTAVGAGITGDVYAMCVHDDGTGPALYAAGWFTAPGLNIAKWNGTFWSPLAAGFNNAVQTLTSFDNGTGPALYAGGWFTASGATPTNRIAKWNGTAWSQPGTGCNNSVNAIGVYGGALYVSGSFTTAGGAAANHLAKWTTAWAPVPSGSDGVANQFTVWDDGTGPALFMTGSFATVGGVSAARIAKFNGTVWSPLGTGLSAAGYGVNSFDDGTGSKLYATGFFDFAGGVSAPRIAKWNGSAWSAVGAGLSGGIGRTVNSYTDPPYGPTLYVGGTITNAGGLGAATPNMAKFGPTPPYIVTPPPNQAVPALVPANISVVAGGIGDTYQWRHYGTPISGATSATLTIASPGPLDWGLYDCVVTNGCGSVTSPAGILTTSPYFALTMDQPYGSLSLRITQNDPAQPGIGYFTTFSFDPLNSSNPGQGPWCGEWTTINDVITQFLYGVPPFNGTLDGAGNAFFAIGPGSVPAYLLGIPVTIVCATYNPSLVVLTSSNVVTITIS